MQIPRFGAVHPIATGLVSFTAELDGPELALLAPELQDKPVIMIKSNFMNNPTKVSYGAYPLELQEGWVSDQMVMGPPALNLIEANTPLRDLALLEKFRQVLAAVTPRPNDEWMKRCLENLNKAFDAVRARLLDPTLDREIEDKEARVIAANLLAQATALDATERELVSKMAARGVHLVPLAPGGEDGFTPEAIAGGNVRYYRRNPKLLERLEILYVDDADAARLKGLIRKIFPGSKKQFMFVEATPYTMHHPVTEKARENRIRVELWPMFPIKLPFETEGEAGDNT
jgi:hypothetical protein